MDKEQEKEITEEEIEIEGLRQDEAPDEQEEKDEKDELSELKNELASVRADFYNYRQRVERDRAKMRTSISEERVIDFIPVLDNLDRALNVSSEATAQDILKGVRMVQRQFLTVMQELGIEPISIEMGTAFDPNLYDAVGTDDVEDSFFDGAVTTEVLRGYRSAARVLRPTQVRVGKLITN